MRRMRTYARFANVGAFWSQTLEKIQIKSRRKNVLVSFFKSELSTQYVLPKMATRFHRRIKGWHMDVFTGYLAEVKNQSQVCKPYA